MKQFPSATIVIALMAGLVVGALVLIQGPTQPPYIMVLVGAVILSAFNMKQSWLIALILGGSIPVVHVTAKLLGMTPAYEFTDLSEFLVPIALAVGGAAIGVRTSANWMKPPNGNPSDEEQE